MKRNFVFLALLISAPLLFFGRAAQAKDGFESVRCGSDIRSALLGKRMSDEPVVQIEKRHADLGLKDLGGDEISDTLSSSSWRICGKEYVITTGAHEEIRDVLAFPPHSRTSPEFSAGTCEAEGKSVSGAIIGVLDNPGAKQNSSHYSTQDRTLLPATAAWKIDEKSGKFTPFPTVGLQCPRSDIVTADGGP